MYIHLHHSTVHTGSKLEQIEDEHCSVFTVQSPFPVKVGHFIQVFVVGISNTSSHKIVANLWLQVLT